MFPGGCSFFLMILFHINQTLIKVKTRIQVYLTYNKKSIEILGLEYIRNKEVFYPPNSKRRKGINYTYKK